MSTKVAVFDDAIELEPVSLDTPVTHPLSPFVKRSNEKIKGCACLESSAGAILTRI